ncbi:MAG: phytanoyl-CoA dioxygenase family protein [Burkholderiaceae bacterium]
MPTISPEQIAQYQRDGFLVIEGLLPEPTRLAMKRAVDDWVAGSRQVSAHDDVYDLEPGHRADAPRVRRIKKPHRLHPAFDAFMRAPAVLEVLQALLGPSGVRLHGSKLNLKAAGFGAAVEWHQDWAFYPHTNDDVLAMGVMLDDVSAENGPMQVLPGSHRGPLHDHHHPDGYFCGAFDPHHVGLDVSGAVPLIAPAGSCSFHHARLVHGSAQNRSPSPRNFLLYEFSAADAFPLRSVIDWDEYNSRLLCGDASPSPRMADCPVRLPFPPAPRQGSICESQSMMPGSSLRGPEPRIPGQNDRCRLESRR